MDDEVKQQVIENGKRENLDPNGGMDRRNNL